MDREEQNSNGNIAHIADEVPQQENSFSVCLVRADGSSDVVCCNRSSHDAAKEFWRCSNNVSAMCGVVQRVSIVDNHGATALAWEFGRGFTFDGKNFHPRPVLAE